MKQMVFRVLVMFAVLFALGGSAVSASAQYYGHRSHRRYHRPYRRPYHRPYHRPYRHY